MKFENQNFPSFTIFVFRETKKFLFALQVQQFADVLLQKVLNHTLFSYIWIAFWPQTPNGGAYSTPPYPLAVGPTHFLRIASEKKVRTL